MEVNSLLKTRAHAALNSNGRWFADNLSSLLNFCIGAPFQLVFQLLYLSSSSGGYSMHFNWLIDYSGFFIRKKKSMNCFYGPECLDIDYWLETSRQFEEKNTHTQSAMWIQLDVIRYPRLLRVQLRHPLLSNPCPLFFFLSTSCSQFTKCTI